MLGRQKYKLHFILLIGLLIVFIFVNLSFGSVNIPFSDLIATLIGGEASKQSWQTIIVNYRLPKAITAIMVGSGLSVSGLLMQTLFRNPLAGPFVLGISSGASLGVAILILGAGFISSFITIDVLSNISLALAASLGSFLVLLAVIVAAKNVRNTMSLLIIGLMFGSLSAAIISVLSFFSDANQIQQYIFWGFGSLGNLGWYEISLFAIIYFVGMLLSFTLVKPLNSLLLGENYANSLGVNTQKSRNIILIITSLLTGVITAFSGPIAFVGLAVPHIAKIVFVSSNHKILLPATAIIGAVVLLICDSVAQLPTSDFTLPINAITSLFGAPIVIWLLIRKKKIYV